MVTRSKKAEKQFYDLVNSRGDVKKKLIRFSENPRMELDAHKLKGKLAGKWSCYLGNNIRMVYEIDDINKEIIVVAVGSHKVYG
ncbi:MAG: type II toxin-antitoxin system mRNA interferase toxin, RelE/StbE family [Nanoarchaeota archaeon]|nr:type II toxin-antitoxin system mRNA interferase toxin, RelE/StbE family [Nanoarchaeota archaeon]